MIHYFCWKIWQSEFHMYTFLQLYTSLAYSYSPYIYLIENYNKMSRPVRRSETRDLVSGPAWKKNALQRYEVRRPCYWDSKKCILSRNVWALHKDMHMPLHKNADALQKKTQPSLPFQTNCSHTTKVIPFPKILLNLTSLWQRQVYLFI